jgi:hypothetical protein
MSKPLGPPLISRARIHVKCVHLKPLAKKKKAKDAKPKGMPKILIPPRGQ